MPIRKFFGDETLTNIDNTLANTYSIGSTALTSAYTGKATEIHLFCCTASANVKYGVYTSSSGPANLLIGNNTGVALTGAAGGQLNTIQLSSPISITASSNYHIVVAGSATGYCPQKIVAGQSRYYKIITYASYTNTDPATGYASQGSIGLPSAIYGWIPPTITDIDTDEDILTNQTNITLTCTDGMNSQGTGKLYLSDNATYGIGTMVEQTINSWSDTAVNFNVVQGALSIGTIYAYLLTDLGQYNSTGFELTLSSSGGNPTSLYIGNTYNLNNPFDGKLQRLQIINKSLSPIDIKALYQQSKVII